MPGESYTYDQVESIYMENQQAITTIESDDTKLESAVSFYRESETNLHGEWDIEVEPILDPPPPEG